MKRFCIIIIILLSVCINAFPQTSVRMFEDFDAPLIQTVSVDNTPFSTVVYDNAATFHAKEGQAALPLKSEWIEIPDCDSVMLVVRNVVTDTLSVGQYPVIAKQYSKIKSSEDTAFVIDREYYTRDSFGEKQYVSIEKQGYMNGRHIALIAMRPCRYNPKRNLLETVKHIEFELFFVNVKPRDTVHRNVPSKYIILSDKKFTSAIKPFADWKKQLGFNVVEAYTQDIGTTKEDIYAYLKNDYLQSSPLQPSADYLLIVGDTSVVPSFLGKYVIDNYPKHYTDFYYTDYTDDMLPDVYLGRMSVSDTTTLKNIIEKTIKYERFDFDDAEFLNRTLMVAGKESGSAGKSFTNAQLNYIKQYFKAKTDTAVYYNPESTTAQNKQAIRDRIDQGNGWVIYSGHGTVAGWQNPSYRIKDVDTAMNNVGKYGIYVNNCCHAGRFYAEDCFTASLVGAQNKGAVVGVGSCDYTTWDEDFYWSAGAKTTKQQNYEYDKNLLGAYDQLFHTHGEDYEDWAFTIGQTVCAGNLAVEQSLSNWSNYYWEVYNIQGDASLMPYTGMPSEFDVNINKTVALGEKSITFLAPPYTSASLTDKGELVAVWLSDSTGKISLSLENVTEPTTLCLTLINQNRKPFIDSVFVTGNNKPFIALKNITFSKKNSEDSSFADRMEQGGEYQISFEIINTGDQDLVSSNNAIKIKSPFVDFTVDSVLFPPLKSKQNVVMTNAFVGIVHSGVENLQQTDFDFEITSNGGQMLNCKKITKEIIAPKTEFSHITMHREGKEIVLDVELTNNGMMTSDYGSINLVCDENTALCSDASQVAVPLSYLGTADVYFHLTLADEATDKLTFSLVYKSGLYEQTKEISLDSGENKEGFEEGFTRYDWTMTQEYPWIIDSEVSHSGNGSARSSNKLVDGKKSQLMLTFSSDVSVTAEFYVKVSSELDYDKLKFFIDKQEIFALHGETNWQYKCYDLASGQHTLCFSYEKDKELSDGSDAAWLDDFVIRIGSSAMALNTDKLSDGDIILVPNPADNYVKINNLPSDADITVLDADGKTVYRQKSVFGEQSLDTSNLPNGIYYIVINNSITKKLLIIK